MEIQGADGSKLALKPGSKTVLGRGSGFNTSDRTTSRRHVLLELVDRNGEIQNEPRASFEVTGKNPVWVRSGTLGEVKVFKKFEKGQLAEGYWLCISGRIPVWFVLKKSGENEEERRDLGSDSVDDTTDIKDMDPVIEFGFLVIGHEFDQYPSQRIRDIKNWNWFLEESREDSEDVEERRGGKGRKRRKGDNEDDDDDDWTVESDDDKEVMANKNVGKARTAIYSARSQGRSSSKDIGGKSRSSARKKNIPTGEEGYIDEDDETLGGFIVDDDDADLEEESEENEEEDFDDDSEDESLHLFL